MIEYPFGVNGTLTRVIEAGEGDSAVVFLHGLGARADRWRRNLDVFAAAGHHAFAIDWPGHGFAQKGADFPYGVPGFTIFLEGLLDALGLSRVSLVGTSLGGHVASSFTCQHSERVEHLVLVGTTGLTPIGPERGRLIEESLRETNREKIVAKLRLVMVWPGVVTPELIEEELRISNSPGAQETLCKLGAYIAHDVDKDCVGEALARLDRRPPIMLVWGAEDKMVPPSLGEAARQLLKVPTVLTIPGAGHAPYFERPELFNPPVLDFLAPAIQSRSLRA